MSNQKGTLLVCKGIIMFSFLVVSFILAGTGCSTSEENSFFVSSTQESSVIKKSEGEEDSTISLLERVDLSSVDPHFRFSANIPDEWDVAYVPQIESFSIYKKDAEHDEEPSQIFIRYFEANSFLTLSTVDILEKNKTSVNGHEAVQYKIIKKSSVSNFSFQPQWRNEEHRLVDVRLSGQNPSLFYVFAHNPSLDENIFRAFLSSLIFHNDSKSFVSAIDRWNERTLKKLFGTFITPENSPVQPEKFSGYHTGLDFEIFDDEKETDVSVRAVCGGPIMEKRQATGYGGVVVQSCLFDSDAITVVYGHLNLETVSGQKGDYRAPGDLIGLLGAEFTPETGGERKHLHLGIHKGNTVDIRGYVENEEALGGWMNFSTVVK